ncbi:MAG: hypothetical protein ACKVWV_06060 [Planctomycetota bacterium]
MKKLLTSICLALAASCAAPALSIPSDPWPGVVGHSRTINTTNAAAQSWFNQGLLWCYGFNHEEATRCFERAAALDPDCAMAYWGIAYAHGPNINNASMDDARSQAAFDALQEARERMASASPVERDLIEALSKRYAWPAPADRASLDHAYSDAMRKVFAKYPKDADVGALSAEAMLDLRPWDQWTKAGEPQPGTLEAIATIDRVLAFAPDHPQANHLNIHAREASRKPELALASANRLGALVPGAGHLVHMPSHIYVRLGMYPESIASNARAIEVDRTYVERETGGGIYSIYRAHNAHFLVYAAMFDGQSALALERARAMASDLAQHGDAPLRPILDGFFSAPLHVLVRFGRWDAILHEPEPPSDLPMTAAVRHYARGLALAALGRVDEADVERAAFDAAFEKVGADASFGNNKMRTVLEIGRAMLAGEVEYRRGNHDKAFEHLRDAVRRDEELKYDEPWGWMQPAAHALGALLLEQGRVDDAEAVYRRDLERHRTNGWALHGLAECLERKGDAAGAETTRKQFAESWKRADVKIGASCFCRTGASTP